MNKVKQLCCVIYLYFAHINVHPLQASIIRECEKYIDGQPVVFTSYNDESQDNLEISKLIRLIVAILNGKYDLYLGKDVFDFFKFNLHFVCKRSNVNFSLIESLIEDIDYITEPKIYHKDMISIARYIREKKKFDEIKYLVDACIEHDYNVEAGHFSSGIHTYACPLLQQISK